MSRYFFALWPDDETREKLVELSEILPEDLGRRVLRQNLHITLAFLGSLDTDIVENLRKGAASIKGKKFSLMLEQIEWWKKPRVVWVGPEHTPAPLLELVSGINVLVEKQGIQTDDRPYQSHLSIARKVMRKPRGIDFVPINWHIDNFCLVQSNTLPSGAVYEIIETWPLSSG